MKKLLAITATAAIIAMAGAAIAADSNTLTVSASVTGTCKFSSGTSTLAFGALDPSASTNPTQSTTTDFWCTKGVTTDSFNAQNGLHFAAGKRQMLAQGTSGDVIPYSLTLTKDALSNGGPTVTRTLTIKGDILNADYVSKTADTYQDTVTIDITP